MGAAERVFHFMLGFLIAFASAQMAHAESCIASIYSTSEGTRTASGIPLNDHAMTAAHKSLPFRSHVRVTNTRTGRSITVTITDRGPFVRGRCIDLTPAAARALGIDGIGPVTVERE